MSQGGRVLAGAVALVKVSYGIGALLAPEALSRWRLAPGVRGHANGRMSLRGFGGYVLVLGSATLCSALRGRDLRPLLALNLLTETTDGATALLEWRDRGDADATVLGSLGISIAGIAAWAVAWRS